MPRLPETTDFDNLDTFERIRSTSTPFKRRPPKKRGPRQPSAQHKTLLPFESIDALADKIEGVDGILSDQTKRCSLLRAAALFIKRSTAYDDVIMSFADDRTFSRLQETAEIEYITVLEQDARTTLPAIDSESA